jgi:hypothetical protein
MFLKFEYILIVHNVHIIIIRYNTIRHAVAKDLGKYDFSDIVTVQTFTKLHIFNCSTKWVIRVSQPGQHYRGSILGTSRTIGPFSTLLRGSQPVNGYSKNYWVDTKRSPNLTRVKDSRPHILYNKAYTSANQMQLICLSPSYNLHI